MGAAPLPKKHLRSVRHHALRTVLRAARGEPDRSSPEYVSQRALAVHLHRTQPFVAFLETLQRRCEVLEFMDIGDSLYEDRMQLYRELVRLSPRRFFPIRQSKGKRAGSRGRRESGKRAKPKTPAPAGSKR